ncbi:toll/interleukin-1 receptor domain-containing protein, partial [Escherichia coli]|uniref:toll/interleukin-1 receptor domain-containing protein n=1 Tax=Escherichia coli TaxID=562 RepID=UPI0013B4122B
VFISYASQNREHARLLREKLRAMGTEAWFDMEQLEAGDNWDQKIRLNVQRCTVFLPLISPDTEQRPEAYFRREWKAAAQRTYA